jgi:meso-butanediol dehydrogenase/(S,S)-butanediol dehydrogenase/diacetyl reductase
MDYHIVPHRKRLALGWTICLYYTSLKPSAKPRIMRLADKITVITGGGTGIGAATARAFAAEGAQVVLFGRRAAPLAQTAGEIGERALAITGDITREDDVKRLVQKTLEAHGRIDTLVHNAGVFRPGPLHETDNQSWDDTMNTNVRGPFLLTREVLKGMVAQGSGNLIFINSILGQIAVPQASAYAASKGALLQLARSVAIEYGDRGIRANSICPGMVETDMTADLRADEAWMAELRKEYPAGRFGMAEDVARACLYLAGDESSYVTGAVLPVDGGYTAR